MRITHNLTFDRALSSFNQQNSRIYDLQGQLSSGVRLQSPDQAPVDAVRVSRLNSLNARMEQYQENINLVNHRLGVEESSLRNITTLYQRARELTIQAGNTSLPTESREAIATELESRMSELVDLINTKDSLGNYVFAGYDGRTKPVEMTLTDGLGRVEMRGGEVEHRVEVGEARDVIVGDHSAKNVLRTDSATALRTRADVTNTGTGLMLPAFVSDETAFAGDTLTVEFVGANTIDVRDSGGTVVAAGLTVVTGERIDFAGVTTTFDGSPAVGDTFTIEPGLRKDAFGVFNQMIDALRGGTDEQLTEAVDRTLTDFDGLMSTVSTATASLGARLNSLESQSDSLSDYSLRTSKTISSLRDTNYAEAASNLQRELAILQAAQQTLSLMQRNSLFNFL
ncbi:MAG: flagellar hook-associated protein FlgL [Pseudomonadota bacterium]